jgi:hypothetical protein
MNSSDISSEGGLAPESAQGSVGASEAGERAAADAAATRGESASLATPSASGRDLATTAKAPAEDALGKADDKASAKPAGVSLIPFVAPERRQAPPSSGAAPLWRAAFDKRLRIGAIAASLAAIGAVAAAAISYKDAQEQQSVVAQYSEAQSLAETVKSLKARLNAMESAKRDEVADLRKSVADLKSGLAATHESSAVVAQLNARADRLEKDQAVKHEEIADLRKTVAELKSGLPAAHDSNASLVQVNARVDRLEHEEDARIEKLGERVDHDAATRNAEIAARLEKLEKKGAPPAVAALAPQTAAPAPTPPAPPALPKQPTLLPPVAANVSKETTGSIAAPQAPIRGWLVREVHGNVAVVEGPYGFRQIEPGDALPGAGRVERIEKRGAGWTVVTDRGVINSGYSGLYRMGGYGGSNGAYGPQQEEEF